MAKAIIPPELAERLAAVVPDSAEPYVLTQLKGKLYGRAMAKLRDTYHEEFEDIYVKEVATYCEEHEPKTMKSYYTIEFPKHMIPAIADLCPQPSEEGVWVVHRINVPKQHRGQGHGSKLLKMVCDDADASMSTLVLTPYSSGPLDDQALIDWYQRYGFTMDAVEQVMVRQPAAK